MADWDESNVWIARPNMVATYLDQLWQDQWDAPYLVDLSTLTHLTKADPQEVLAQKGFQPVYIVCTRPPGSRWLSAFQHMRRKRADGRSLARYLAFYESFIGLSLKDLRQLEDELISRDLSRGVKSSAGVFGPDYFSDAYPVPFEADPSDPRYQFRYFGETIDMLYKRPEQYVELPLNDPGKTLGWISHTFGINPPAHALANMNRNSMFNRIRHHPNVVGLTQRIPRSIRQRGSRFIETSPLFPRMEGSREDAGCERDMTQLVEELLSVPLPSVREETVDQ